MPPALVVLSCAMVTALATGLGAVPFAFVRALSPAVTAYANALAAGLMLGASFGLVAEGTAHGGAAVVAGAVLGVVFLLGAERLLQGRELSFGAARGTSARRMVLLLLVMTVHSFAEGVAVGVSFGGAGTLALVITAAIAVHNIPEGLAITAVLRPTGVPLLACAGWSIVSSLPQPLMAIPAWLFVESFRPALPWGLGFAAGAMALMVFEELLPEALEQVRSAAVAAVACVALVGMLLFQSLL
jgi:zinc transporter ZupT